MATENNTQISHSRSMKKTLLTPILLLLLSASAQSQNLIDSTKSVMLYTDEDFKPIQIFGKANDQNYTMGFGLGFSSQWLHKSWVLFPNEIISSLFIRKDKKQDSNIVRLSPSLTLNGTAFTPLDLRRSDAVIGDRPYAFLLALSTKELFLNTKKKSLITTEFSYGLMGTKIGQWVQTKIHNIIKDTADTPIPMGWDNQISKGGEPTFLYSFKYERLLYTVKLAEIRNLFELKYGGEAMIGYYTGVAGNLGIRFGLLDPANWYKGTSQLINQHGIMKATPRSHTEAYVFANARPMYKIYNELLSGGFKASAYTLPFDEIQQASVEWNFGIGLAFPGKRNNTFAVNWMLNAGRTSELNTSFSRSHQWGTINLTYNFGG